MPYIITTKQEDPFADALVYAEVSRRAVATLDEAREATYPELDERGARFNLIDGTVIEVELVPSASLAARIPGSRDYSWGFSNAELVEAFNERA